MKKYQWIIEVDVKIETAMDLCPKTLEGIITGTAKRSPLSKRRQNTKYIDCSYAKKTFTVDLKYPLEDSVAFKIERSDSGAVSVGEIVWAIAQAYRKVYEQPEKFGVFGHGVNDLFVERIYFDPVELKILCDIGS